MKHYGVWILPSKQMVTKVTTRESEEMEIPGHWLHDNKRMVFSTTSKGLAVAQAETLIFTPAEAKDFDE